MTYDMFTGTKCDFYEAEAETAEIVNFAIRLGRPILVEGEAGCGKTTLARAIAHELGLGEPVSMTVKSTFQAKDLLYRFNALRRLQDIQDPNRKDDAKYVYPYVTLQPLGRAIAEGSRAVVLIDEIDKADIDFPNDLLDVLGAFKFDIEEIPLEEDSRCREALKHGRSIAPQGKDRPIVVITSNREKQLPEPFLRRCLYINLKFPEDPEVLGRIVKKNLGVDIKKLSAKLVAKAVATFQKVRLEAQEAGAQKPPATSELLDWVRVLHWNGGVEGLDRAPVPHWKVLFKTMQDVTAFEARSKPELAT